MTAKETAMTFLTFDFNYMNFVTVTNQLNEQLVRSCTTIEGGGGGRFQNPYKPELFETFFSLLLKLRLKL